MKWRHKTIPGRAAPVIALVLVVLFAGIPLPVNAQGYADASSTFSPAVTDTPDWMEPRGLSILDFVGQVPEDHLRGSILVFDEAGVTRYMSGKRDGDKVTIEVSMSSYENFFTEFPCLGRRPIFDEWPVAVPASEMRIYSAGRDITDQVHQVHWYFPANQAEPIRSSAGGSKVERYDEIGLDVPPASVKRTLSGAIIVPENMGCTYFLLGSVVDLSATFVFDYPRQIQVEALGSETFSFQSYIGVGNAGRLDSLRDQMASKYSSRHDKFSISLPAGADYVWLNYPPTPVSAYAAENAKLDHNIQLPSSGSYRLIGFELSTDHVVSMGLPLHAQWADSDLSGGNWLPGTGPISMIAAPEYFVPPGVPYDRCMRHGGCPDALLDRIYNTEAQMTLHYYRVRRLRSSNLMRVPLRQVGRDWDPGDAQAVDTRSVDTQSVEIQDLVSPATGTIPGHSVVARLPMVLLTPPPPTYPDDLPQEGCPCGWFDEYFRMLDVIPGLEM